uniref:Uncharacterized protein n=1 Tax=Cucumis melo TaxID=3656 RepID=A0A9I9E9W5_CUCME
MEGGASLSLSSHSDVDRRKDEGKNTTTNGSECGKLKSQNILPCRRSLSTNLRRKAPSEAFVFVKRPVLCRRFPSRLNELTRAETSELLLFRAGVVLFAASFSSVIRSRASAPSVAPNLSRCLCLAVKFWVLWTLVAGEREARAVL